MTPHLCTLVTIPVIMMVFSLTAMGGPFEAVVRDFCEVNNWPCPYVCWDREAARAPFPAMIQNAWRRQNLLADCHFTGSGGELSQAGQHKVRWILTEAPVEHRAIFVRRTDTPGQTVARVNAIREYAAKVAPDVGPLSIMETYLRPAGYPAGWPGAKDDSTARKFQTYSPNKLYLPDRGTSSSGGN